MAATAMGNKSGEPGFDRDRCEVDQRKDCDIFNQSASDSLEIYISIKSRAQRYSPGESEEMSFSVTCHECRCDYLGKRGARHKSLQMLTSDNRTHVNKFEEKLAK